MPAGERRSGPDRAPTCLRRALVSDVGYPVAGVAVRGGSMNRREPLRRGGDLQTESRRADRETGIRAHRTMTAGIGALLIPRRKTT